MNEADGAMLYALIADGSSDRVLLPIIRWAIRQLDPKVVLATPIFWCRGSEDLTVCVRRVATDYRPHLVFIHRDAERVSHADRKREIPRSPNVVPVIPVRMTEAWLLTDESAIRRASGNPNGSVVLDMPPIAKLENIPDPKVVLHRLLRTASELRGRRLKRLSESSAVHQVAEITEDFQLLRKLAAFSDFEADLAAAYGSIRTLPN